MRFQLPRNPFRLRKSRKKTKAAYEQRKQVYASLGAYKTIQANAREFDLTLLRALDLLCAKGSQKIVEEQLQKRLSPKEMQLEVLRVIAETATKYKLEHGSTPGKESPGENSGATGH